jgi:hypothetical protein
VRLYFSMACSSHHHTRIEGPQQLLLKRSSIQFPDFEMRLQWISPASIEEA